MSERLITTLLTSGVVAALIIALVNLISLFFTNNRMKAIEKYRMSNEIEAFRYKTLYEISREISELQNVDLSFARFEDGELKQNDEELERVVSEIANRFSQIKKIKNKALPLFDPKISGPLNDIFLREHEESSNLTSKLYTGSGEGDLATLLELRMNAEDLLVRSIIKQINLLITRK